MAAHKGHPILIPHSDNSDNDYSTKTKIVKLNQHNWHNWKSAFKEIIIGKGHKEILDDEWIKNNSHTKTYCCKNALALSLLRNSNKKDLLSFVKSSKSDFSKAYKLLANECGINSLIVIGEALIQLVNLTYKPGKILKEHTSTFKNAYVNLTNMINSQPTKDHIMNVSPALVAIFLIKSLRKDNLISSLTSTLYNIRPFTLEVVSTRILLGHLRQESNAVDASYYPLKT